MPDDFDRSQEDQATMAQYYLEEALRKPLTIPVINCADNCGTGIPHGKACTYYKDCLEDWELTQRAEKERPQL